MTQSYKPQHITGTVPGYVWRYDYDESQSFPHMIPGQLYDRVMSHSVKENNWHNAKWFPTEKWAVEALEVAYCNLLAYLQKSYLLLPKDLQKSMADFVRNEKTTV